MDIGSIFLILAVMVGVVLVIIRPFFEEKQGAQFILSTEVQAQEHERSALLAERDRILSALLELDADHQLGKVMDEEYRVQRDEMMNTGADVLRRLDAINLKGDTTAAGAVTQPKAEDDELEAMIAARKQKQGRPAAAGYCPACGSAMKPGDKFCSNCGEKVTG